MSVRVMSQVWEIELPDSEKLVLLALADCANHDGDCWPSMATLSAKCSKSDRTVQGAIKSLVSKGHLTRNENLGKGCSYIVHPRKDCGATPEAVAPPKPLRPEETAPPKPLRETPEAASDKPSKNHQEVEWGDARAILASDEWKAFVAMRRQIHRPLNPTGQRRILLKLRALAEAGYPPGAVLDQSTANCWRGVFEISDEGKRNGQGNLTSLRGSRPSPAFDLYLQGCAEEQAERSAQAADRGVGAALPAIGSS